MESLRKVIAGLRAKALKDWNPVMENPAEVKALQNSMEQGKEKKDWRGKAWDGKPGMGKPEEGLKKWKPAYGKYRYMQAWVGLGGQLLSATQYIGYDYKITRNNISFW